ncbi:MAG: aldehyde dehydrogenase EutE [Nitrospinae bacterium]|nr:aldehyde dehydrogenase EutE [Nitrospinota bacterium]
MKLDEDQIASIVRRVAARLGDNGGGAAKAETPSPGVADIEPLGIYGSVNEAVAAAKVSYAALEDMPLMRRAAIIESMRAAARAGARRQAELAVEETALGNARDKLTKNLLAINKTPGVEALSPVAYTGDDGIALMERAPYGVIGSITPCTNPTATVVNNAIGMIAAGNAVVFNAHPLAKQVTNRIISLLNHAIVAAEGPANLLTAVSPPTIESAQELMRHPDVRLLVVTGGPGVVKAAMASGKRCIAAGPGNPPAVVDQTANLDEAARHLVDGASFDNNIVCVVEKEILCVESVAARLMDEMAKCGAHILSSSELAKIEKLVIGRAPSGPGDHGQINKDWVGKDAVKILAAIGSRAPEGTRLLIFNAPADHPLVIMEQLMPVTPVVKVKCVNSGIELAQEVEHGFLHTAVMHSTNVDNLSHMARVVNTSIFVKNGPSVAGLGYGGEGYTSFTIASPTGEGLTCARHFTRERRCTLKDRFRII